MTTAGYAEPQHPVVAGLGDLSTILTTLSDEALWNLSAAEKGTTVVEAAAVAAQIHGLLCRLVGEVDATGFVQDEGATSTIGWLRSQTLMTPVVAAKVVSVARSIRTECCATGAELCAGTINLAQAAVISKAVGELPDEIGPELRARAEEHLLSEAAYFDAVSLTRLGRRILDVVAPEVAEAKLGAELAEQEERDRLAREFRITPDGYGRHHLSGWLDNEGAAILTAALDPLSAPCPRPDGRDPRSGATRRADALVELARRALDGGDLPETGGEKPQLSVTIPLRVLMDGIGHDTLNTGEAISPEAARRLACDAGIIPAVLGGAG